MSVEKQREVLCLVENSSYYTKKKNDLDSKNKLWYNYMYYYYDYMIVLIANVFYDNCILKHEDCYHL